jgi:winged helix-turn-helix protein
MTVQAERPDPSFDEQRAKRFAERLTSALNEAALVVMTSLGHRGGLFDALSTEPPLGSAEIAATTGLQERYVREWLAAMVAARVIEPTRTRGATGSRRSTPSSCPRRLPATTSS